MIIRKARPDEAESLTEISHAAKRYWGYPEHWIEHWSPDITITPAYITANQVYAACDPADEILGFYAMIQGSTSTELDHLWIRPEHIGKGVGKELFVHAIERAKYRGDQTVQITADPNAEGFYAHMGAVKIAEFNSEIDGQPRTLPVMIVNL